MTPAGDLKRHVAVVGAGFAGLAAARALLQQAQGRVVVTLVEADTVVGGRAKRALLRSGPVEMGATWFHGTQGNPVYDYALKLTGPSSSSSSSHGAEEGVQTKDYTANANGSDPRWELQLVAPGESAPLSGPRHQAVLAAFEQYSLAVEDIAEDAEAAAATVCPAARGSSGSASSAAAGSQDAGASGRPAAASAVAGCSLGQVLRARFDDIMGAAGGSSHRASAPQQQQKEQQHQEEQQQEKGEGSVPGQLEFSRSELGAWLASDASGQLKQAFAEGWGCRERLQRAYDGFHSFDCAGLAHITEYQDLDGPNIPVPGGYQAIAEALAAEAQGLGLQLHLGCPVQKISWARPDGKVALLLQPTPAAAEAFPGSSAGSSVGSSAGSSGIELVVDACVVTCSLGVLKASAQQLFEPGLPGSKVDAIQRLHIGQVEKLFVEWPPAAASEASTQAVASGEQPKQQQQQPKQQQQQSSTGVSPPAPPMPPAPTVGPRKPKPQQLHDMAAPAAAATAAAAAAGAGDVGAAAVAPGGATSSSAAAGSTGDDDPYTTYCLMWPTQQGAWGLDWQQQQQQPQQQQQQLFEMDVPAWDPVYHSDAAAAAAREPSGAAVTAAAAQGSSAGQQQREQQQQQQQQRQLPEWLYGLHSWRYGDGPEWIKPAPPAAATAAAAAGSSSTPQPPSRSAVIWVTGRAAQQMARLSDQQVLQDLELLLQTYPAIPRPGGPAAAGSSSGGAVGGQEQAQANTSLRECTLLRSTWTSSPYFRGSYSYPSHQADGGTADALAAPLTAADAAAVETLEVAAGAAPAEGGGGGDSSSGSGGCGSGGRVLVCFAGEATSRVHMGTVHGAFNSGVREAHRLLHSWGLVQPAGAAGDAAAGAAEQTAPAEYHAAFWL